MSQPAFVEMTSSSRYGRRSCSQQRAEVLLGRAVRRAVVVGQVEVGDAEVEGAAHDRAAVLERPVAAEVLPEAERHRRQLQPAAAAAAVLHAVVALGRGGVRHACSSGRGAGATSTVSPAPPRRRAPRARAPARRRRRGRARAAPRPGSPRSRSRAAAGTSSASRDLHVLHLVPPPQRRCRAASRATGRRAGRRRPRRRPRARPGRASPKPQSKCASTSPAHTACR